MFERIALGTLAAGIGLAACLGMSPAGLDGWGIHQAAAAEDYPGSREALTDLLALAPDTAQVRAGAPLLAYADFEATVRASYADAMPGASLATLSANDALLGLTRLSAGERYLQYFGLLVDGMPDLLGVGIDDVRRELEFAAPADWGMVLGLDPAGDFGADIAAALAARGFAERDVAGVTVWHRGEDGSMDPSRMELADPFGGAQGLASRLFHADGRLAGTPAWPLAEAMAQTAAGTGPSLADDPAIAIAVEAATDPAHDGMLLQFILLNGADTMPVPESLQPLLAGGGIDPDFGLPLRPEGDLPPYQLMALADRFAGDHDEVLVILVYPDAATAEQAATVLADRFAAFAPVDAPPAWRDRLAELDAVIEPAVLADPDTGVAAAVARISYRAVFPTDPVRDDGLQPNGGALFRFLNGALWWHQLTPLMVFE